MYVTCSVAYMVEEKSRPLGNKEEKKSKTKFVLFWITHLFIAFVYRAWERFSNAVRGNDTR